MSVGFGFPQGIFSFPGINSILGGSYTVSHGTVPGIITLRCAPQANFIGQPGPITITYNGQQLVLQNCLLDKVTFERGSDGLVWIMQFLDRRWLWKWGAISGRYNLRNQDGSIQPATQQTPQQLATLCFQAANETLFDVSGLPNTALPLTEWDDEVPMAALEKLVAGLGCRIVFEPVSQITFIKPLGVGLQLPVPPADPTADEVSLTADPQEQPDKIAVAYASTRHQNDFLLVPMGLDSDNTWKPISQMSTMPASGWTFDPTGSWDDVNEFGRDNAQKSVYLVYAISAPDEIVDVFQDEGVYPIDSIDSVLPIETEQVEQQQITNSDGTKTQINLPAEVYGYFWLGDEASAMSADDADSINPNAFKGTKAEYKGGFHIDRERGWVVFHDYVYAIEDTTTGAVSPATMYLRCACPLKDPDTNSYVRYESDQTFGNAGTPTRYLKHAETQLTQVPTYDGPDFNITGATTNQTDLDTQAGYYIQGAQAEYQIQNPYTVRYIGLRFDLLMDGAISQISWETGPGGAFTTACYNDEQAHILPSYKERQLLREMGILKDVAAAAKPAAQKNNARTAGGSPGQTSAFFPGQGTGF